MAADGVIVVVLPSRGRPERAREAVQAIRDTAHRVSTRVVLAVDADDPELPAYRALRWVHPYLAEVSLVTLAGDETGDLVRATNTVSRRIAEEDPTAIIGNLGDDHLARTPGWDRIIEGALETPGIAYGRDGIHDERLPTAPFISASIVRALGYYALPRCRHLYIDDAWREIGRAAGVLRYVPEVLFEHMHPAVGKAESDEGYVRANAPEAIAHDKARYQSWHRGRRFLADVARVRRALEV